MTNLRITNLLSKANTPDRVFPATDLYNEGWMLRLVIDWFSRNSQVDCDIQFLEGSRWFSEALLPSQFLARQRGDKLAESWTHADGVIGHFEIGKNADGDLTLNEGAKQLVVIEAKMFSKLSPGVTNAKYFNQAARNVACMAEVTNRAGIYPASFEDIAFYVVAPQVRIDEGVFSTEMSKDSIREIVQRRVSEYEDEAKVRWFEEWFLPTLAVMELRCIAWEELLAVVSEHNEEGGMELGDFYARCMEFNKVSVKH